MERQVGMPLRTDVSPSHCWSPGLQVYEPEMMRKKFLTLEDKEIKLIDVPERIQVCSVPFATVSKGLEGVMW